MFKKMWLYNVNDTLPKKINTSIESNKKKH